MEPESKRVGNSGGFNLIELLDRMTKVEKQLENSKEKHERNVEEQQTEIEEQRTKIKELQLKLEEETQKFEERLEEETQKFDERLEKETQKFEERLEKETQKFEERLEENEYNLLMVHANELEWTVGLHDVETRYKRNEVTHGGDIKLSIRTIAFLERRGEIRRAKNASIGFKTTYGFSIHELRPVIATAPEEIVELFNLGGTLRKLDIWRKTFSIKSKTWIEGCDQIIDAWLRAGGGSDSCIRNQAKEEYMKISQQMADCR
jgi:vacuolar-type H+-ATPase subunit I/STV1